jgi:ankyrin repeat protein
MITLQYSTVPAYLRSSTFCVSLTDDNDEISIPNINCKLDESINSEEDLVHLLSTLQFWGVDSMPSSVVVAALNESISYFTDAVLAPFVQQLPYLQNLLLVRGSSEGYRLTMAARLGELDIMKYLVDHGALISEKVSSAATEEGHLHCLQFIYEMGGPWCEHAVTVAATYGHVHCLRYLLNHGCVVTNQTCLKAAQYGHFECLKCAFEHGAWISNQLLKYAAEGGSLDCLRYAHEQQGCELYHELIIIATKKGSLPCVQYLHMSGIELSDYRIAQLATETGYLNILKYAVENGCMFDDSNVFDYGCTFECLEYLFSVGIEFNADTMLQIGVGNIEIVRFLHEHGCPWDERTLIACMGVYDQCMATIEYACEHQCPWSEAVCTHAASNDRYIDALNYLHKHGCPWSTNTMQSAVKNNAKQCIQYLIDNNCPI